MTTAYYFLPRRHTYDQPYKKPSAQVCYIIHAYCLCASFHAGAKHIHVCIVQAIFTCIMQRDLSLLMTDREHVETRTIPSLIDGCHQKQLKSCFCFKTTRMWVFDHLFYETHRSSPDSCFFFQPCNDSSNCPKDRCSETENQSIASANIANDFTKGLKKYNTHTLNLNIIKILRPFNAIVW